MAEQDLIIVMTIFFAVGIIYSAIISYVVQFLERASVIFDKKPIRIFSGFLLAAFTVVYFSNIMLFIQRIWPGVLVVTGFVGAGFLMILFYIAYEKQLEDYFVSKWVAEDEKRMREETDRRAQIWMDEEKIRKQKNESITDTKQ